MATTTKPITKKLDDSQRSWLKKMGAALEAPKISQDALIAQVDAAAIGDGPARTQASGLDDLFIEFVCRIVIINKTDVALRKRSDSLKRGRYQIAPPPVVPARQAVPFTIVGKLIVVGKSAWIPDGDLDESWELEYALAPPSLISPKLEATRTLNSSRFEDEFDDSKVKQAEMRFILKQREPPPSPQSFLSRVVIQNDTDVQLRLSTAVFTSGVLETKPPPTIPPRQTRDFEVRSQGTQSQSQQQFVAGDLTWTPEAPAAPEIWSIKLAAATGLKSTADSEIRSDRLIAEKPKIDGTNFHFILRDKNDPPPPRPESFVTRVVVSNQTKRVLTKVRDSLAAGKYESKPLASIPPFTMMEFAVRSEQKTDTGQPREVAAGSVVWHPEGADENEDWVIQYAESPQGKDESSSSTILSERFIPAKPEHGTVYFFKLNETQPPPPPRPTAFVSRVVIVNNTDVALKQKEFFVAVGTVGTQPPSTIAARSQGGFTVTSQANPFDGLEVAAAFAIWEPEGFPRGESWTISIARDSNEQDGRPDQTLNSIRFAADTPTSKGTDFRFSLNQAAEPEFKKPAATRQPTLRLNDKGVDGWVEYLQEQLNAMLKPSPNLKVDGHFGGATQKAVFAFQKQEGIQKDGTVGNQTWAELRNGPAEPPGTDQRKPHTFKEQGVEARWLTEDSAATFSPSKDELVLICVSLGDSTSLEGQPVNVFVTPPGGKRKGFVAKIGERIQQSKTGQGDHFKITLADFRKAFPSNPESAPVQEYVIEAFFTDELGGDFYTSTKGGIKIID